MKISTKANADHNIDTGTMIISVGNKCNICMRKAETVRVSDIRVCPSCIYQLANQRLEDIEKGKIRKTASVLKYIIENTSNQTLIGIINAFGRSKTCLLMLSKLFLRRRK